MQGTYKTNNSNSKFTLVRGRKNTALYYGLMRWVWTNSVIDNILGGYDKQVEHFKANLK